MIKLLNYNLNSDYESNKDSLNQLDNYVALTEDNQMVHLKPLSLPNIFYVTTNNTSTTIYKRTDNQDGSEKITLENGENKLTDWNYGFYFGFVMKQEQITSFDLSNFNSSNVTNMKQMFTSCSGLTSLDVSKFNTSKVTNMSGMFQNCTNLTSLDVTNFDTSKVTNMNNMFTNCRGLTSLDVSKFNTSMVTSMFMMFSDCRSLTSLDLSNFDTSRVTSMGNLFWKCPGLTSLDLSNFDTSNDTDMRNMFYECSSLTSLDVSNFDTSKVTMMSDMFSYCTSLTHIKCKQAFKDWCITNQTNISLPTAMRDDGEGTWEIIDLQG